MERLIFEVPQSERDSHWEDDLLRVIPQMQLRVTADQPITGPDGWPYLAISSQNGDEPATRIFRWLSERGIGFVLNMDQPTPDFVASYGMVWNWREHGELRTAPDLNQKSTQPTASGYEVKSGHQLYVGPPSQQFIPTYARNIVRDFLMQQKVSTPRVLMISSDQRSWDLAFSLESLKSPPTSEHQGILEALSWFFPQHYSLVMISEKAIPGFADL